MDPDKALADLKEAIKQNSDGSYFREIEEHFEALDKWLSAGGFLPKAWNRHRRATL